MWLTRSDLRDIALPGRQDELVAAVAAANPRTVVVLQTGGPVEMPWLDAVPAVLQAWYPGQEAGNGFANMAAGFGVKLAGRHSLDYAFQPSDGSLKAAGETGTHKMTLTFRMGNRTTEGGN